MKTTLLTAEGFEKLQKDKENLLLARPVAVEELRRAREMGDLSENGFYKGARAKLSRIDSELRHVTRLLKHVQIIQKSVSVDVVGIGNSIILQNDEGNHFFTIVGEQEANPKDKKISNHSPIGREVIGKKVGEKIFVTTPSGVKTFTIGEIS